MAKLKAPLFSLGAAGALGEALVYFGWKGLNCVRSYVIPANPKTGPQNTQRGYLTAVVTDIHEAQAHATLPLTATDVAAYALKGSTHPTPRTWFNEACKIWIDQKVAALLSTIYRLGGLEIFPNRIDLNLRSDEIAAGKIETGKFHYGTSKTALINSKVATPELAANMMSVSLTGLTSGIKYFIQFRPATVAAYVGAVSGIYYGTPT